MLSIAFTFSNKDLRKLAAAAMFAEKAPANKPAAKCPILSGVCIEWNTAGVFAVSTDRSALFVATLCEGMTLLTAGDFTPGSVVISAASLKEGLKAIGRPRLANDEAAAEFLIEDNAITGGPDVIKLLDSEFGEAGVITADMTAGRHYPDWRQAIRGQLTNEPLSGAFSAKYLEKAGAAAKLVRAESSGVFPVPFFPLSNGPVYCPLSENGKTALFIMTMSALSVPSVDDIAPAFLSLK